MSDILPIIDKLWINLNLLFFMAIYRYKEGYTCLMKRILPSTLGISYSSIFSSIYCIDRDHRCHRDSNDTKKTSGIEESRG